MKTLIPFYKNRCKIKSIFLKLKNVNTEKGGGEMRHRVLVQVSKEEL